MWNLNRKYERGLFQLSLLGFKMVESNFCWCLPCLLHYQANIDFNTGNMHCSVGMDFLIHPLEWINDERMAVRRTLPRVGFFISPLTSRFPSALETSLGKFHCPWEISRFLGMWNPIHPDSRQCTYTISEWPTTRYNDERLVIHMSGLRGWPDNKTINVPSAKHWKKMCQSMPPASPLPPIPQCQQQLNIWLWICCECKRTRSQIDLHSCSAECDLEGLSTTKVCWQIEIELSNTAIWVDKIKTTTSP